jgi:hypothetical protein
MPFFEAPLRPFNRTVRYDTHISREKERERETELSYTIGLELQTWILFFGPTMKMMPLDPRTQVTVGVWSRIKFSFQ